jgi:hypothetical protein
MAILQVEDESVAYLLDCPNVDPNQIIDPHWGNPLAVLVRTFQSNCYRKSETIVSIPHIYHFPT